MLTNNFTQVAALEKLLGICNNLGARYNPGNASITTSALGALLEQAQQNAKAVTDAQAAYTLAVNNRREAFHGLPRLVSELVRSAIGHNVSEENARSLKLLKNKFYSVKSRKPPAPAPNAEGTKDEKPSGVPFKTFDAKVSYFASIISIIEGIPDFKPNEAHLGLEGLKAKLSELQTLQSAVAKAANDRANARINRNRMFYGTGGVTQTGKIVKDYVRSVTGVRSEIALAIGKVRFLIKTVK